jgi:hypothetical protein
MLKVPFLQPPISRPSFRLFPQRAAVIVQTTSKFEAFLRGFQRKNLSGTARGARKAYWNRRAQRYMFTPSIGREQ